MNITQIIPLADGWGMHGGGAGWWIVGVPIMLLMMGAMMWMMMRGMGGGSASAPSDGPGAPESPLEILERRFAEGAISIEEYRARREALIDGTDEPSGDHEDEPLTASRVGGG